MKAESHQLLGLYLLDKYMPGIPRRYAAAFLAGCVEPDKNPTTYLKGSLRSQWLRGHNWGNAQRYMERIAQRLERRKRLYLPDYYVLGKLIHYVTDAFTYPHNVEFQANLREHCLYEAQLNTYFRQYIADAPCVSTGRYHTVMDAIHAYHGEYLRTPFSLSADSSYAVTACSVVISLLAPKLTWRFTFPFSPRPVPASMAPNMF